MTDPASTADEALARALASDDQHHVRLAWGTSPHTGDWHGDLILAYRIGQQAAVPRKPTKAMVWAIRAVLVERGAMSSRDEAKWADDTIAEAWIAAHDAATTPPAPDAGNVS